MAIRETAAVVLRERDVRETSKVVTLFTRDFGKIKGLAKGLRSNGSCAKFSTNFELYSLNNILYYETRNCDTFIIAKADLIDRFEPIRSDIDKSAYASYFVQLIERANELWDANRDVFELLISCLRALCSHRDVRAISAVFEIKLLDISGFLPILKRADGLSEGCIRTIEHARRERADNSFRLKIVPKVKEELRHLLTDMVKLNIAEDLPSFNYLKKMRLA